MPGSATARLDGAASGPYTTASFNAIAANGRVYLTGRTDTHVDVIVILSAAGAVLHQSVLPASANDVARDLVLDSQGRAYVIREGFDDYIHMLSSTGVPQSSISSRGTGSSFALLAGPAMGPGDTLHVSARDAFGGYIVEKYGASGFANAFPTGNAGAGPIEVDAAGNIYLGSAADRSGVRCP